METGKDALTVGELARRTGLTVRTLHHWDTVGLLSPARRSDAGYRLYDAGDVARLQQIVSLRQLGWALDEIRACLERPGATLASTVDAHLRALDERMEAERRLRDRLTVIAERLRGAGAPSVEEITRTIEEVVMLEKHFTPEQMERIRERGREVGEARIREVEAEWPRLIAEVRAEMERGTDPADERLRPLARRWRALVDEFTGGDAEIERGVRSVWREDHAALAERHGDAVPTPELMEYAGRAMAAHGEA